MKGVHMVSQFFRDIDIHRCRYIFQKYFLVIQAIINMLILEEFIKYIITNKNNYQPYSDYTF